MAKPRVWTEDQLNRLQSFLEEKFPKSAEFLYYSPEEGESAEYYADGCTVVHHIPTAKLNINTLEINLPKSANENPDYIIDLIRVNL